MGAQARHLDADVRLGLGDQARQEIDLVGVGHRDQHLGVGDAGLPEGEHTRGAAPHDLGVEQLFEPLAARRVLLDDDDLVPLADQPPGDQFGDLAASGDEYAHGKTSLYHNARRGSWL